MIEVSSASFTRPADTTAYASGDLVANSTTVGSVVPLTIPSQPGRTIQIRRLRLRKSSVGVTNAQFRVHLFNALPVAATNGDNGAISMTGAAGYLHQVDLTIAQALTDGAAVSAAAEVNTFSNGNIYAFLEARAAYTPVSAEIFTLTLEVEVK